MYDLITQTLEPLQVPYAVVEYRVKDGENYPDAFLVCSLVAANSGGYYSNDPTRRGSVYRVTFYTRERKRLNPVCEDMRERMRSAGFFFVRFSPDIPHDSGHFSRSADFRIYQREDK